MEPWLEIATKLGIPVVAAALIAWFLAKQVWPWMKEQVEKAQSARERDLDRFASQISKVTEEQTKAIRELADEIRRRK